MIMNTIAERPRYSCSLGGAITTAASVYRVVPVLHAGPGCGMQLFNGIGYVAGFQAPAYIGSSALPSSNTRERDVVFGGEDRLRNLLRSAQEVMDADLYLVLTGCTAALIGDDVESIIEEFRTQGVSIAHASTPGFKGTTYHGYDIVWKAFLDQVVKPPRRRYARLVNIFGIVPGQDAYWQGTLEEIERLLKGLGLEVNTFHTHRQGIKSIHRASEAALNIVLSPWLAQETVDTFQKTFGIPYLRFAGVPVGPTDTEAFLWKVATALEIPQRSAKQSIDREIRWIYDQFEKASLAFTGFDFRHRFAVLGDSGTTIGILRFLANDFGQIPVLAVINEDPPEKIRENIREELSKLEFVQTPEILFTTDPWQAHEKLREIHPSFVLGSSLDKSIAQEIGALHASVSFPITDRLILSRTYSGIRGSAYLIEDFFAPALTAL
ncbi:MAG: nitrogenase component 1 [Fibrobacteraceae bacterium]